MFYIVLKSNHLWQTLGLNLEGSAVIPVPLPPWPPPAGGVGLGTWRSLLKEYQQGLPGQTQSSRQTRHVHSPVGSGVLSDSCHWVYSWGMRYLQQGAGLHAQWLGPCWSIIVAWWVHWEWKGAILQAADFVALHLDFVHETCVVPDDIWMNTAFSGV